jgi:hypothetical protein
MPSSLGLGVGDRPSAIQTNIANIDLQDNTKMTFLTVHPPLTQGQSSRALIDQGFLLGIR